MRFALVTCHLPEAEGSSPARALLALGEGLIEAGHQVEAWSWRPSPPEVEPPAWCRWSPLPPEPAWRTRGRALVRPRGDVVRVFGAGWEPPSGAVAIADEPTSVDAVLPSPASAVTFHYRTSLDLVALRRLPSPWHVQQLRLERRASRQPRLVLAYSERVGAAVRVRGRRARVVPMGYPLPAEPVAPVEAPVAALLAGWHWPPNRWALDRLLAAWPEVRARVPSARLLVAGRGLGPLDVALPGVEVRGEVGSSRDLLAEAAVFAFPCPPSSGPKGKVLEALSYGVPVLTTPAGVEGLAVRAGQDVEVSGADRPVFAEALASLLLDGDRREQLARAGRAAFTAGHSPLAAGRARAEACAEAFPTLAP